VAALLYEHILTFEDEVHLVWFDSGRSIGYRLGFIINRYVTEALAIYVVYGKFESHIMPARILISSQYSAADHTAQKNP
jgi:hypothetical protein